MSFYITKQKINIHKLHFVRTINTLPSSFKIILRLFTHTIYELFCKRASRFVSLKKDAAITVEASLLFPLFLSGCMSLLFFIEVFRMESMMAVALSNTARMMGQYMCVYGQGIDEQQSILEKAGLQGIRVLAIEQLVMKEIGEERLAYSMIEGGKEGLSFLGSYVNGETVKVMVHYSLVFPVPFFEVPTFPVIQNCYLHGWSGVDKEIDNSSKGEQIVYITPYGTVYHTNRTCTHLKLSVKKTSMQQIRFLRNSGGGKYYACEKCIDEEIDYATVWITKEGDCYHGKRNCSGLKRSVQAITLDKAGSRSCCSKCQKEKKV